jgi:hypothetical protein
VAVNADVSRGGWLVVMLHPPNVLRGGV